MFIDEGDPFGGVEDFGDNFAPLILNVLNLYVKTSLDRLTQSGGGACKNQINASTKRRWCLQEPN